jgi:hypothetical protein
VFQAEIRCLVARLELAAHDGKLLPKLECLASTFFYQVSSRCVVAVSISPMPGSVKMDEWLVVSG